MPLTGGDSDDIGQTSDLNRDVAVDGGVVTERPIGVVAPCQTVPSERSAILRYPPPATAITPESPVTGTGVWLSMLLALPSCPAMV